MKNTGKFLTLLSGLFFIVSISNAQLNAKFSFPKAFAKPGSEINIPLTVDGIDILGAFGFSFSWDTTVLKYKSYTIVQPQMGNGLGNYMAGTNNFRLGWFSTSGIIILNKEVIVYITFLYLGGNTAITLNPETCFAADNSPINYDLTLQNGSVCGSQWIDKIVPSSGANTGEITVNIFGTGFNSNTKVKLTKTGYNDIVVPDSMLNINNAHLITATLYLKDQRDGDWNVILTKPGDTLMTLLNGFKITGNGEPDTYAEINGFSRIRVDQWQNYTVICGNRGCVNAVGVPLWIIIPKNIDFQLKFPVSHFPDNNKMSFDTIPYFINTDTILGEKGAFKVVPVFIPVIPAEQTIPLNILLKSSVMNQNFKISVWIDKPVFQCSRNKSTVDNCFNTDAVNCFLDAASFVAGNAPDYDCVSGSLNNGWKAAINLNNTGKDIICSYITDNFAQAVVSCMPEKDIVNVSENIIKTIIKSNHIAEKIGVFDNSPACSKIFLPQKSSPKRDMYISTVSSFDPNDKIGPFGYGLKKYTDNNKPFSYAIHFENAASANASAQNVVIYDTLDTKVFDLKTLQFGFMGFGSKNIIIPNGYVNFTTQIDMRPDNNIFVRLKADLDDNTGVLTWQFTALDPATLQPVTDPLAGFLPPNKNAPEGEGSVFYSIKLKDTISNNAHVSNKAYIYFDTNPPIPTSTWKNIIDNIPPVSKVNDLPQLTEGTSFNVTWAGTDEGSGIQDYSVYYSVNDGAYRQWLNHSSAASTIFKGKLDSTYSFYSIAIDSAGNVESAKLLPDTKTTLVLTIGIKNITADNLNFKIFPNPATDQTTITYNLPEPAQVTLSIYDLTGRKIRSWKLEAGNLKNENKITINTADLNAGIYFLKLSTDNISRVMKFIKQ